MNKGFLIVFTALVLLSGCIKMQVTEDIDSDGMSTVTMIMEPVNKTGVKEQMDEDDSGGDPCEQMNMSDTKLTDVTCKFDKENIRLIITGRLNRLEAGGLIITGTRYRLDVQDALDDMGDDGDKDSFSKNNEELFKMKDQGVTYDYIVKMPGSVITQAGGTRQFDGSVKFDLLDLPEGAYVESQVTPGLTQGSEAVKDVLGKATGERGGSLCCCIPALTAVFSALTAFMLKPY
ncbi:hypothetical protein ACFLRF_01690 [Candidatus Altiarchaeota archaeon]